MNWNTTDQHYMKMALDIAEQGRAWASPNPFVGAVIVRDDEIVGKGFTQKFGGPHAEIMALREAGDQTHGATMYVTLEPCCHHGKTPPCTGAIIAAGIHRVVIALEDPNPLVHCNGISQLRQEGIQVETGLMKKEMEQQNEAFLVRIRKHRPFVTLKAALTLDGFLARNNGDSKWISSPQSRELVHQWRWQHDAILVGENTVRQDDPMLNSRVPEAQKQPIRMIFSPQGNIPIASQLVQTANEQATWLLVAESALEKAQAKFASTGIHVFALPLQKGQFDLPSFLNLLTQHHIGSLFLEGGSGIYSAFLAKNWVDKLQLFYAPKIFGKGCSPFAPLAQEMILNETIIRQESRFIDQDLLLTLTLEGEEMIK